MAWTSDKDDEQKQGTMNVLSPQAQQQQQSQQPLAPQNISGAESAQIGGAQAPAQQAGKPASSGTFTNIRKFFDANPNAGGKIAQAGTGKAQTQASQIGQAVEEKKGQFQASAAGAAQGMQQAYQSGLGAISGITGESMAPDQQVISQFQLPKSESSFKAMADAFNNQKLATTDMGMKNYTPGQIEAIKQYKSNGTPIPENIAQQTQALTPEQFQSALKGQQVGGQEFSNIGQFDIAQQQAQQDALAKSAAQAASGSGRFDLVRQIFQSPERKYTSGQQRLDTAFLNKSPEAKQQMLTNIQEAAKLSGGKISEAESQALVLQTALSGQQKTLAQKLEEARLGAENKITGTVAERTKAWQDEYAKRQAAVEKARKTGSLLGLTAEERQMLGIKGADPAAIRQNIEYALTSQDTAAKRTDPAYLKQLLTEAAQYGDILGGGGGTMAPYLNLRGAPGEMELRSRLASQEEVAKASALAKLAGRDQTMYDTSIAGQQDALRNYGLDTDTYNQYVKQAQESVAQQLENIGKESEQGAEAMQNYMKGLFSDNIDQGGDLNHIQAAVQSLAQEKFGMGYDAAQKVGQILTGRIQPSTPQEEKLAQTALNKMKSEYGVDLGAIGNQWWNTQQVGTGERIIDQNTGMDIGERMQGVNPYLHNPALQKMILEGAGSYGRTLKQNELQRALLQKALKNLR